MVVCPYLILNSGTSHNWLTFTTAARLVVLLASLSSLPGFHAPLRNAKLPPARVISTKLPNGAASADEDGRSVSRLHLVTSAAGAVYGNRIPSSFVPAAASLM